MKKFVLITACAFSLLGSACKKKEAVPSTDPAGEMKPTGSAETKPAETKPAETKPAETAPAAAMTAADYETKTVDMADKMMTAFTAGGTDCAKAAAPYLHHKLNTIDGTLDVKASIEMVAHRIIDERPSD